MAKKTCYYELLDLDRKCDAAEIKTKYRKMALRFHPDKASNNDMTVEAATAKFQEIQEAYSCLSDVQERAWYDSHREQILKGDDGATDDPFKTKMNLYKYMHAGCFKGFGDDAGSFFTVYSDLFQAIDQEEEEWEDADEEHVAMPPFGNRDSEWADISSFYRKWLDFYSRKAFGHADKWNPKDAPNRQTKRAMEGENKKARQVAKKEYNSEVRQIVQVVQRRDPRYQHFQKQQMKEKAEKIHREEAEKEEKKAAVAQDRAQQKEAARKAEEERWAEIEADKAARKARGEVVSEDEDSSSEEQPDVWSCEPCRKTFKSEKQFDQHVKTKKHLEIVKKLEKELEKEMRKEKERAKATSDDDETDDDDDDKRKADTPFLGLFPGYAKLAAQKPGALRKEAASLGADEEELEECDDADDAKEAFIELILRLKSGPSSGSAKAKAKPKAKPSRKSSEDNASSQSDSDESDGDAFLRLAAARQQRGQAAPAAFEPPARSSDAAEASSESSADDQAAAASLMGSAGSKKAEKRAKQKELLLEKQREKEKIQQLVSGVKKANDKAREDAEAEGEPEAASASAATESRKPKGSPAPKEAAGARHTDSKKGAGGQGAGAGPADATCAVCGKQFESRSKMFEHLKTSGHAAPKELPVEPAKAGKKKKR